MNIDLQGLIGHRAWVDASRTVRDVFQLFVKERFEFMGVLEEGALLGMCSKRDIGTLLGSQYGFSLYANKPIREHLREKAICVTVATPIQEVFGAVFKREVDAFYDDVLLIGLSEEFLGLIFTQTLVKLQNSIHLENIRLLEAQRREIVLKNEQIETDLRMSRELQQALLPDAYPVFPPGASGQSVLRFHHIYRPYGIVGGDFFHVKRVSDRAAGIFIADVMGHGVRPALITAMLRAMLEEFEGGFLDPAGLIGHFNRELTRILKQAGDGVIFSTALYLLADAANRRLRYASAGHPLPLLIRRREGRVAPLDDPDCGTVLGLFEDSIYSNREIAYEMGDSIFLYTDGVIEVENAEGQEFGIERLCDTIAQHPSKPLGELFDEILASVMSFSASGKLSDDLCLVGVDLA
ncbi:MAG: SpoIIE family protein phosphatase [Methylococcaceae bacterium]|nr:SpoIIE family protein phosphatase [Methylococcaceae bacterium]